jgi:uncharacterized protein (TIGR02265 family)
MPADPADLQQRIAAATPGDTVRGLIFNAAFQVIRELGGETAMKECDPAGTGSRIDFFAYPVVDFLKLAWAAANRLEAKAGSAEKVFFAMGHRAGSGVLSSALGKTLTTLSGMDPHRLLTSTASGYKATVSYGERTVAWKGERHAHFTFKRDFLVPPFHCGVFAGAVEAVGGKNVKATGFQTGFLEAEYHVTWD